MSILTIRLDNKLDRELANLAKRTGLSRSDLAREALRRHILVRDLDHIRAKLQPYAEAAGYLSDEDFFRDIS
jgi:predicted transcriptional regulator